MSEKKKKRNRKVEAAIYLLLVTWSILLILLIFIFILKLNGYDTFGDWWNTVQKEKTEPKPTTLPNGPITPEATPGLAATPVPEVTLPPDGSQTVTPQPTQPENSLSAEEILRELEERYGTTVKEYGQVDAEYYVEGNRTTMLALPLTGDMRLDAAIREDAAGALKEAQEHLAALESELTVGAATLALNYDCFHNDNWLSVVFRVTEQVTGEPIPEGLEKTTTRLLPLVYNMETGEQVTGQEMFHETYFAILKERLMTELVNYMETEAGAEESMAGADENGSTERTEGTEDPFFSYATPYRAEDYLLYYITKDKAVFYFPEGTLTEQAAHKAFIYEADLSEALAFMKYNLSGKSTAREIRELDPNKKMVALTFDDGVHSPVEEQLLQILAEYDARVTFFSLGERTFGSRGDTLRDLYDAGHEIASHTYSHKYLTKETQETFWHEINNANLQIAKVVGHAPDYLRMPGGEYPAYSDQAPMPLIHWSVDSRDWKSRNADAVYKKVLSEVKDGDIVLMHSLYQSTADAVERLLPELAARGYQFVTVSELFYYKGITAECGKRYKNGD